LRSYLILIVLFTFCGVTLFLARRTGNEYYRRK